MSNNHPFAVAWINGRGEKSRTHLTTNLEQAICGQFLPENFHTVPQGYGVPCVPCNDSMAHIADHPAEVKRMGPLSVQVCVPKDWSDKHVLRFVEDQYPCGTSMGWTIRQQEPIRNPCACFNDHIHIMLDA